MASIQITSNADQVIADLKRLPDLIARRAAAKALNRVLPSTRRKANQEIRSELNLKAGDVNKLLRMRRANASNPEAQLRVEAKRVGLIKFKGTRETKRGVSVKPKKKRTVLPKTFIATMSSGHRGVFERKRKAGSRSGRLPIAEKFSSHPAQVLSDPKHRDAIAAHVRTRMEIELAREIAFRLSRSF